MDGRNYGRVSPSDLICLSEDAHGLMQSRPSKTATVNRSPHLPRNVAL